MPPSSTYSHSVTPGSSKNSWGRSRDLSAAVLRRSRNTPWNLASSASFFFSMAARAPALPMHPATTRSWPGTKRPLPWGSRSIFLIPTLLCSRSGWVPRSRLTAGARRSAAVLCSRTSRTRTAVSSRVSGHPWTRRIARPLRDLRRRRIFRRRGLRHCRRCGSRRRF